MLQKLEKLNKDLTQSVRLLRKNGEAFAKAERDYKVRLRQEALKLRAGDMPVTLIQQIVYGIEEVAELRYKRDIAQTTYEANKEAINVFKLQIRCLESQIQREWNSGGTGD
jgi:hypothetical protein